MSSLYVPLVLHLEVKKGLPLINFADSSNNLGESSPSLGEKTRRRLMSGMMKRSPPTARPDTADRDAPLGPDGGRHDRPGYASSQSSYAGRRTYSEVVVETLESDRMTQCSESSFRTSKAGSEPPHDVDHINYYFGNPLLERTEGIVHFYKYNDEQLIREAQCRMLCMLSIPAHVTVRELISFLGSTIETIERIKIVRNNVPNQYMAVIKFKSHNDTVVFFESFNGIPFNSLEPDKCSLLFVDRIECVEEDNVQDVSHLTEIPSCTVCLERLDDGVVSVLCNHTFHAVCLQQWADTTCPVCRYIQSPEMVSEQRCSDCGQSTDLWICLICGNIGCGRYAEAHASRHFEITSHTFCLQIGGERVWDYAGDNYVHRLIQTDGEGKMVEYERGLGDRDGENKSDKLEGIKMEYTCLLSSQLDSQRKYFESRMAAVESAMHNMEKMTSAQMTDLEKQFTGSSNEVKALRAELTDCQQTKVSSEKKNTLLQTKLTKVTQELSDEKSMNAMLRKDQDKWKSKLEDLEAKGKQMQELFQTKIRDQEEQIRDLMLHFEGQTKLQEELSRSSEQVESISVSSPKDNSSSSKSRRRTKK